MDKAEPLMKSATESEKRAREQHQKRQKSFQIQGLTIYILSFLGFFAIWHFGSVLMDSVLFPSPIQFMVTFFNLLCDGWLIREAGVSLQCILSGFAIGTLIAAPLGLLLGFSRIIRLILDPYVEMLRFIPSIAVITVAVTLFGLVLHHRRRPDRHGERLYHHRSGRDHRRAERPRHHAVADAAVHAGG
jgi:NitT/TauT family transport system permease protein